MRRSRRWWSLAFGLSLMAVASLALAAERHVAGDESQAGPDIWRRTAHGWQRIDDLWAEALGHYRTRGDFFVTDDLTRPPSVRWDFHPAMLVVVQLLAIKAAFDCFGMQARRTMSHADGGRSSLVAEDAPARAA